MNKVVAALLIILSVTFLTHANVLNNAFLDEWDDFRYAQSPEARAGLTAENIKSIFSSETVEKHFYFHPLTKLSFALEYPFFRTDPRGYHLDNLLLHLLNTMLVFWFVYLLTGQLPPAFLASALFGIHPLQVETVAWIAARKELLFTCFYLAALIAYVHYCIRDKHRTKYLLLCFGFFVCSLLSKPSAATLPLALLILDYYFDRGRTPSALTLKVPFFVLSLFVAVSYFITSRSWSTTIYTSDYFSGVEKIVIGLSTSAMYFCKLIAPADLSAVYLPPEKVEGALPLKYFLMAGFPLLALIFLWQLAKHRKIYCAAGLFFFATVFLSGSGKTFMGDHYVYLPSLGFFLLLAAFLSEILDKRPAGTGRRVVIGILVIYLSALAAASHARGKVWKDSMALFDDALRKDPTQPVALRTRGILYAKNGQFDEAIADLSGVIDGNHLKLPGTEEWIVATRAMFYAQSGRLPEAVKDLTRVIEIGDANFASKAYNERGLIARSQGDIQGAIADFDAALSLDPGNERARLNKVRTMTTVDDHTLTQRENGNSSFLKLFTIWPDENVTGNNPVLLYDLDRDGFSEIILPASNMIIKNAGNGTFAKELLFKVPQTDVSSAFLGEFTGDAEVDLVLTRMDAGTLLFKGQEGAFDSTPMPINIDKQLEAVGNIPPPIVDLDFDGNADNDMTSEIALEFGARPVVSDDINMDGRADLLVGDDQGNVYGLLNTMKTDNHWVGVILQGKDQAFPWGARVIVATPEGEKQWQVESRQSVMSPHPNKRVFSLLRNTEIDYIEVQWLDGRTQRLDQPQADRYYKILPSH